MWSSGTGGDDVGSMMGNPGIVRAGPVVGTRFICQNIRRKG